MKAENNWGNPKKLRMQKNAVLIIHQYDVFSDIHIQLIYKYFFPAMYPHTTLSAGVLHAVSIISCTYNLMYKQSRVRTISYPTNLMYNALIVHRGLHTLIHPIWWNAVRRDTRSAGTPFGGAPGLPKYCLTEDYRL